MQNIIVLCRHCESPISFSFFRFRFGRRVSSSLGGARVLPSKLHPLFVHGPDVSSRPDFKYTQCTPHPHCVSLLSRPDARVAWSELPHTPHLSAAAITPCFHIHSGGDTTLTPYSIYYAINELRRLWCG